MENLVYANNYSETSTATLPEMNDNSQVLFPTTINSATKMYRYQNIAPATQMQIPTTTAAAAIAVAAAAKPTMTAAGTAATHNSVLCVKTRKYSPRNNNGSSSNNDMNNYASSCSSSSSSSSHSGTAPYNIDQSQSVQRRNARERNRVLQVNNSFARLRQHIPQAIIADLTKGGGRGPQKKISKVDTLRIAVEYIKRLQGLVRDLHATHQLTNKQQENLQQQQQINYNNLLATSANNSNNAAIFYNAAAATTPATAQQQQQQQLQHSNNALPMISMLNSLQQQQQLNRQQYPNHPLSPISLNAYSPSPPPAAVAVAAAAQPTSAAALLTQQQVQQLQQQQQQQMQFLQLEQQTSNSNSCHSPTSSYNSSMSFDSGTFEAAPQQLSPLPQTLPGVGVGIGAAVGVAVGGLHAPNAATNENFQLKFEPYDNFNLEEEDCTPDDEEILDYISLWQEE